MSEVINLESVSETESEKPRIKSLANCKPSEFLKQTFHIYRAVEQWLKLTDFINILKRVAPQKAVTENMTDAEKAKVIASNLFSKKEQKRKNIMDILEIALDEHPEETIQILGMCCFIEPEDADNYNMAFYLEALTELLESKEVRDFFISLAKLGQMNISIVSKA